VGNGSQTLFEVSWEVCNKVGGIHTVVSSKARSLVDRFGDQYVAIGPWVLSDDPGKQPFEQSRRFGEFEESCREMGVPVRVGRWNIPGRPRTLLLEFTGLYEKKDEILAELWKNHQVDSLFGGWDYIEPVLFGYAAGMVIERWWSEFIAPLHGRSVAQFHEWMTGSGILYLKDRVPAIGTVFTTHATMLGRAVASTGRDPGEGLQGEDPAQLAQNHGVISKHSMEGISARKADVFTTVSAVTADEAELFHGRRPDPVLPNGIDPVVIEEILGESTAGDVTGVLENLGSTFLGEDLEGAWHVCISGRYEFHNKGLDLFLDALAGLDREEGRKVVAWFLIPAGNSGLKGALRERLSRSVGPDEGALGLSTHNLFDRDSDPIHKKCRSLGLMNRPGGRVRIIHVPIYLEPGDGLFDMPYEKVLSGMHQSCFPSFYEPWGYTPVESLAVGVPTVTTDHAGFGRWVQEAGLDPERGVHVLSRVGRPYDQVVFDLIRILEERIAEPDIEPLRAASRDAALAVSWKDLIRHYFEAFDRAAAEAADRSYGSYESAFHETRRRVRVPVRPTPQGKRPHLHPFEVSATLPDSLQGLSELAENYWWSWDTRARSLFAELSNRRWKECRANPVRFLREVYPEDLERRAADEVYIRDLQDAVERFRAYMAEEPGPWRLKEGGAVAPIDRRHPIAYFCAEFGVHESLALYSGGLGILAGDHVKSASDLNLPLVGVGLFYRKGYFRQQLTAAGDQIALEEVNDPRDMPVSEVKDGEGRPLRVEIGLPGRRLLLGAWKVQVGRVPLYLLDSDLPENLEEDRAITAQLYGGDHENRLRQEIVLGRGGIRMLEKIGIEPAVYHMNEGHAAFLAIQRVGSLIRDHDLTFEEAREQVRATTVFTTHTPVPAGHDRFGEDLMRRYFSDAANWVGLPWERFFRLGEVESERGVFNMTLLAVRFASYINGVSQLHRQVSKELFQDFWPQLLTNEVPVEGITNGVHLPTWIHPALCDDFGVLDRAITGEDVREGAEKLDLASFWRHRRHAKKDLCEAVEENLRESFLRRGDSPKILAAMTQFLDPDALILGFARRFAPYKRAQLLFQDPDRLAALLSSEERPVLVLFAGKAHPRDGTGQDILKRITELCRDPRFLGRVLFLEGYDMALARKLVQGVDVWLNNPIRPYEASGTSGMKAAANGALNLSVSDGWWEEGYDGENGWIIGGHTRFEDRSLQDEFDGAELYRLLEEEVVPSFFDRNEEGLPEAWLARVRHDLETIPCRFSTERMVREYAERAYLPLALRGERLAASEAKRLREIVEKIERVRAGFDEVRILDVRVADLSGLQTGDRVEIGVDVDLGPLSEEDVYVEFVLGHRKDTRSLENLNIVWLPYRETLQDGTARFEGGFNIDRCGSFSYGVRVRARHDDPDEDALAPILLWA